MHIILVTLFLFFSVFFQFYLSIPSYLQTKIQHKNIVQNVSTASRSQNQKKTQKQHDNLKHRLYSYISSRTLGATCSAVLTRTNATRSVLPSLPLSLSIHIKSCRILPALQTSCHFRTTCTLIYPALSPSLSYTCLTSTPAFYNVHILEPCFTF